MIVRSFELVAAVLAWNAGQQSFSFEAPAITCWEATAINRLNWYPVGGSPLLRAVSVRP